MGLGLVLAARLSVKLGWLKKEDTARIERIVLANRLPVRLRKKLSLAKLLAAMKLDKKVRNGKLRFVALRAIGQAETVEDVPEKTIRELWRQVGAS